MSKKRRTRQEKIISQLRRQLSYHQTVPSQPSGTNSEISQEAISPEEKKSQAESNSHKKIDVSVFSLDLNLIRRDLLKTFVLASIVFGIEFMLYWWLK